MGKELGHPMPKFRIPKVAKTLPQPERHLPIELWNIVFAHAGIEHRPYALVEKTAYCAWFAPTSQFRETMVELASRALKHRRLTNARATYLNSTMTD